MDIIKIHDRAMLAYLSIGCWSARKLDTKATTKLTKDSAATSDAARVNKHLLASADDKLRAIQKLGGEARRYLDAHTLPWDDAGNRLLPNEKAIEVIGELTGYEHKFRALVDDFVQDYPQLRDLALLNLGDLADPNEYPSPEVVRQKFAMRLSFSPMATGFSDMRTGLTDQQVAALQQHFEANARRQMSGALENAWKRLREDLERYRDRLSKDESDPDKKKVFRDSMVENLRDTCTLLQQLNVFDDDELERVRLRVLRDVAKFDADELRESDLIQRSVASEVDAVLDAMKQMLGEDA